MFCVGVEWTGGNITFNTVRLDSKGRVIIPCQLRDYLRLKEGTPLIIANGESRELRIIPLLDTTIYVETVFADGTGALSKLINAVSRNKGEILMSSSKTVERGKVAEWSAIIDTASCNVAKLEEELKKLDIVKKVKIDRRSDVFVSKNNQTTSVNKYNKDVP